MDCGRKLERTHACTGSMQAPHRKAPVEMQTGNLVAAFSSVSFYYCSYVLCLILRVVTHYFVSATAVFKVFINQVELSCCEVTALTTTPPGGSTAYTINVKPSFCYHRSTESTLHFLPVSSVKLTIYSSHDERCESSKTNLDAAMCFYCSALCILL